MFRWTVQSIPLMVWVVNDSTIVIIVTQDRIHRSSLED